MNTDPALFRDAKPYPHVIIDGLCPGPVLAQAMPAFDQAEFQVFQGDHEHGKSQADPAPCALMLFRWMRTLKPRLEEWTGIQGLEMDLTGGGLHQTTTGGHLDLHVDFNRLPDGRYRRLNMLLFATKRWEPDDGGALLLGTRDDHVVVAPGWNRLVVFETGEKTWHGHPYYWRSNEPRRSFAAYWYTHTPPEQAAEDHSTIWADSPKEHQ